MTISVAVVLVVVFQLSRRHWYDAWSLEAETNFWVAIGTVALALVTTASVVQSSRLSRGDERRHQQGYAPILRCVCVFDEKRADDLVGIIVKNSGVGPALRIHFSIIGTYQFTGYVPAAGRQVTSPPESLTIKDYHPGLVVNDEWLIGRSRFDPHVDAHPVYSIQIEEGTIKYHDLFGNLYTTRITNLATERYEWQFPKNLIS